MPRRDGTLSAARPNRCPDEATCEWRCEHLKNRIVGSQSRSGIRSGMAFLSTGMVRVELIEHFGATATGRP